MNVIHRFSLVFWALGLGFIVLYVFGLVMGVFSPAEVAGFTVAAALMAASYLVHAYRVQHEMHRHAGPGHDELMNAVHHSRERRGF